MRIGELSRTVLETPLNWIFSSEANVRILRELALAEAPLAKSEIARRSGVTLAGVVKALPRLFDTGVVTPVGTGGRQAITLRDAHPLRDTLEFLFRVEALHRQKLVETLAEVVANAQPPVRSAWLHESTDPRVPLGVGVLAHSADVSAVQDTLREELAGVSVQFGVPVELFVVTAPDIATLSGDQRNELLNATLLYGPNPVSFAPDDEAKPRRAPRTHADRERQSLRRALFVVRLLDDDPALPKRARKWLVHRLHTASERETSDLQEWLHLLDSAPISTLQYVLLRVDERSKRLRQSNPFIMVLSHQERKRMVRETAS